MGVIFVPCSVCRGSGTMSTTEYIGGRYVHGTKTCTWCGGTGGKWVDEPSSVPTTLGGRSRSQRAPNSPKVPKTPEEEDDQLRGFICVIAGVFAAYKVFDSNWDAAWWIKALIPLAVMTCMVAILSRLKRTVRALRYIISAGVIIFILTLLISMFTR